MEITKDVLQAILDSYPYEIVFVDTNHIVQWMNQTAKKRYGNRVNVGNSLFNCHNENTKGKIESFLQRARNGESEMFETRNHKTGEREFFTPVKDHEGNVIGYFERHEVAWSDSDEEREIGEYWTRRV